MLTKRPYKIYCIAVLLVLFVQTAMAAFTGKMGDDKDKFSLKTLNKLSKNYSLTSFHGTFKYKGSLDLSQQQVNNGIEINSLIRYERGNTTYVYPYKYRINIPLAKFKTPSPQQ